MKKKNEIEQLALAFWEGSFHGSFLGLVILLIVFFSQCWELNFFIKKLLEISRLTIISFLLLYLVAYLIPRKHGFWEIIFQASSFALITFLYMYNMSTIYSISSSSTLTFLFLIIPFVQTLIWWSLKGEITRIIVKSAAVSHNPSSIILFLSAALFLVWSAPNFLFLMTTTSYIYTPNNIKIESNAGDIFLCTSIGKCDLKLNTTIRYVEEEFFCEKISPNEIRIWVKDEITTCKFKTTNGGGTVTVRKGNFMSFLSVLILYMIFFEAVKHAGSKLNRH